MEMDLSAAAGPTPSRCSARTSRMSRRRRKPITFNKIDHFGFVLPTVQSAVYMFTFAIKGIGGPHSRTRIGKFASRQRLPFARLRCAGSRSQTSPQRPATSLAPRGRERLPTGERCLMGVDHSPPPWQSCARQPRQVAAEIVDAARYSGALICPRAASKARMANLRRDNARRS